MSRSRRHGFVRLAALLVGCLTPLAHAQDEPAQEASPRDSTVTEQVEVRLVLVDTLVIDRAGRTIADLRRDDFELFVDYDPVPIDSLDQSCDAGASEDPRSVARLGDVRSTVAPAAERRIVLAVDYMHLEQVDRVDVIERMRDMIRGATPAAEEIMIVAITGNVHVEQTFTRDRAEALATLDRMENDISLWLPPFDHLHEGRFFRSLERLTDLLSMVDGSKAIVLFSNIGGPSASDDLGFESVASRAALGRIAFYPVLARGLSTISSPKLARLAVETGGRFTENTNDLSLGYARAQRDLTCRYVLGFYDRNSERGKPRRVSVRVRRAGLRAVHANNYEFPTRDEEHAANLRSGLIAPGMFADSALRARLYPLRPINSRRWESVLAIQLRNPPPGSRPVEHPGDQDDSQTVVSIAAELRRANTVITRIDRQATPGAPGTAPIFLEAVKARPGEYSLAVAATRPGWKQPIADGEQVILPPIPNDAFFLTPPVLGRRLPGDQDLLPLVTSQVSAGLDVAVSLHVCRTGTPAETVSPNVTRSIRTASGELVRTYDRVESRLANSGLQCQRLVDALSGMELPAGDYVFHVELKHPGSSSVADQRHLPFSVVDPAPAR